MYSSEDLERFYFQYQTEAMAKGISIEQFCSRNKVPYNIFYKWYKDTRNKIVEVKVDIEQKQELLARESISRPALDYREGMTAEEQKRYINYLAERVREADLGLRARDAVLLDFLDKQKEYDARLSKLDAVLARVDSLESALRDELKKRKAAERQVDDLKAKLKFANKNRFGDKMSGSKKKRSDVESDLGIGQQG